MSPTLIADDTLWPLAVLIAEGRQDLPRHLEMLAAWDAWFARGQRFCALRLFLDDAATRHAEGVAQATKTWMRNGAGDAIRTHVAMMAMVVPPTCWPQMKHLDVHAVFGISGGIFQSVGEALAAMETTASDLALPPSETCLAHLRGLGAGHGLPVPATPDTP